MWSFGMFRLLSVECDVQKLFINNGRLMLDVTNKHVKSLASKIGCTVSHLADLAHSGVLLFPTDALSDEKKTYKTFYGPVFFSGSVVYTKWSINNLQKAMTRLTNKREPKIVGLEEELDFNQRQNASIGRGLYKEALLKYYNRIKERVGRTARDLGEQYSAVEYHSNLPHIKRALRVQSLQILKDTSAFLEGIFTRKVEGKVKFPEFAKPGKYPRMIGDYTCPGSLYGGFLMDSIKEAFSEEYSAFDGHKMVFVKSPNREVMLDVFHKLVNPELLTFVYHSDDSCAGVRCEDGMLWMNVDISSCDTSNRSPVFEWLEYVCESSAYLKVMKGMVAQCRNPLYIANPFSKKEKLKFKSSEPIEYSGSLLTTALNNVASSNIGLAFSCEVEKLRSEGGRLTRSAVVELMIKSARNVGYLVTCEVVTEIEGIQFLKNSPFTTQGGGLDFFLNLGVVLRSLGSCDSDLPGKSSESLYVRAYRHVSSVLKGYCHAGNNDVFNALRQKFPIREEVGTCDVKIWYHASEMDSVEYMPNSALCKRYGCTEAEIEQLVFHINECDIGTIVSCSALEKIYKLDYGISWD